MSKIKIPRLSKLLRGIGGAVSLPGARGKKRRSPKRSRRRGRR